MLTIQTQNPESTGPSLKIKTAIIVVMLLVLCVIGILIYFNNATNEYSAKVYDNNESVEEIFSNNQKSFIKVASLLKDSKLFDYLYSIDKKSIFNTSIPNREKFFTKKEYNLICDFFNDYQPYEIGKSNGDLYFVFLCKTSDVTLYYTERKNEELADLLNALYQNTNVEMIDDGWYFSTAPSDIVR